ncbi:MAG: histidinol-phosphate transaminase [Halobacteriales archaeon]
MISERVRSVIEAGSAYPLDVAAAPAEAVRLNANENPLGPPPGAVEAIRATAPDCWRYPEAVDQPLREAIAASVGVDPSRVRLTNGSDELLELVCTALFDPGDRVVIPTPTFGVYELAARLNGLEPTAVELDAPAFDWSSVDLPGALASADGAFVCRPNNPTGTGPAREAVAELLETGKPVVLDEAYVEFEGDSLAGWTTSYDNLVVARTFSKFYGLAGVRVGYAVAAPEVVETLGVVRSPYSVNRPAQAAARAALADEAYPERVRRHVRTERDRLRGALEDLGMTVVPSATNFLMASTDPLGLDAASLVADLEAEGILLRDLAGHRGLDGTWVRVTVGRASENDRFITALRELVTSNR